ncbi:hypothetical protein [Lentzea sp. NPDC060358]|uniref:hypothetical protein n=1 Tax=Lentzea sp. NPDC060358 TaxID=3347103 RepID=UPI003658EF66
MTSHPVPPVRLLLVFPGAPLVRKAVRAGLDVRVVLDREHDVGALPLPEDGVVHVDRAQTPETARIVRKLIAELGATHVLDGEGFPLRVPVPDEQPEGDLFGRELVPGWSREPQESEAHQLVVTTLTVDGMHRVVGITERVEQGSSWTCVFPATLEESATGRVRAVVTSMLDLVGHEFGPAQTRIELTGAEPRVVRSQPCFSIDRISDLIEAATGFDIATEFFRALSGAVLQPPAPRWFAAARLSRLPRPADGNQVSSVLVEGVSPDVVRARLAEAELPPS